jgi:hypothetical protein
LSVQGLAQVESTEGLVSNSSNPLFPGHTNTPLGAGTTVMGCAWCIRRTNGYE